MKETHIKHLPVKATLTFAWSIVREGRALMAVMVACACAFAMIELILPVIGQHLFDALDHGNPADVMSRADVWRVAWHFLAFLGTFWILRTGMFYVFIPFSAAYMRRIVQMAFDKVQTFSIAWHNDTFAGVTVRNITRGMSALDGLVELMVTQFLPTFLFVSGTAIYLLATGRIAAGLAIAVFVIAFMAITGTVSIRVVAPRNRAANEADSRIGGLIADAITCVSAIKAFGTEAQESVRIREGLTDWARLKSRAWYAGTSNGLLQTTLIISLRAGLVIYAIYGWARGVNGVGEVFYYMSIASVMQGYLRDFGMQLRMLQNHINDLDPVAAYMQMIPAIADAPDARVLHAKAGEVTFEHVTFGYKPELPPLFNDMNVSIGAGQSIALVGRSGSGKTSFVKILQRLYDVQGGRIAIDGQDIAHVTQESLHRAIALVPQEPVLFHRTLAENIAYARPGAGMDEIRAAARDAYIDDFIMTLPEQYKTLVGERGVKLSGGERQRVAIARAILADRPILALDEATSSLDSVSEALIQKALDTLMSKRTTLIIAHRLSTIRKVDRILVFSDGKIVEDGRHETLLSAGGMYRTLYDAQVDGLIV